MSKIVLALLVAISACFFGLIFWANRALYTSKFDSSYWTDKFDHSQWQIPESKRVIGDDGLYLYEGYRLMQGGDPTTSNAQAPPLGKYLIGLSVQLFGNGYWYGFFVMSAALFIFFFLADFFLENKMFSFLLTLAVGLDPLIISQFPLTMLDGLQLVFFETTVLSFLYFIKKNNTMFLFLSGISLGLFSGAKFPIFSPFLAIVFLFFIIKRKKSWVIFLLFAVIGYLLPYIPYFLSGHSLPSWITAQKYMISFYAKGSSPLNVGSILTTLIFNRNQNIFTRVWETVPEWSISWSLITLATTSGLFLFRKKISLHILIFIISLAVVFVPYIFITFWTRYLVVILPMLYLAAFLFWKKPWVLFGLIAINAFFAAGILFPTPETTMKQFTYDMDHGFFQDMYENLTNSSKSLSRAAFLRYGQKIYFDGQIESATSSIHTKQWTREPKQIIPVTVTYVTRQLGTFTQTAEIPVVNENGRWRIQWNWNELISGFENNTRLETSITPAKRGTIFQNKKILAEDAPSYLISIIPQNVDQKKEDVMLNFIHTILENRIAAVSVHNRYVQNSQPDWLVAVGVIMQPINQQNLLTLKNFPGIILTPTFGRFSYSTESGIVKNSLYTECCSVLYNTTAYDGVTGLEKQYNSILKGENGGTLQLLDEKGNVVRTIISREKKDGKDLHLK